MKRYTSQGETEPYLIPNRKLVSWKILEAYYALIEEFRTLTQDRNNQPIKRKVNGYIFNLFELLKHYDNIKTNVTDWDKFATEMNKKIIDGELTFDYQVQVKCIGFLNKAVYESGLTKIEWDEEEVDEIEDTRRAR